jgi:hypothetical protein
VKLEIKCHAHPRYAALLRPRVKCPGCIAVYKFRTQIDKGVSVGGFTHDAIGSLDPLFHTLRFVK